MNRTRLVLALVGLLVAAPVGLLVHRALESAAAEERAQRQALADTTYAAVERELAGLLEREEARAWDEWRHLRVPEGEVAGSVSLVRSPLAELPAEPWNLGWFQIEPDGSVGTPFVPERALAATLDLEPPPAVASERDERVRRLVREWWAARPSRPARPVPAEVELAEAELEESLPTESSWRERLDGLVGGQRASAGDSAVPDLQDAVPAMAPSPASVQQESFGAKAGADHSERRRQERAAPRKAEVFKKQASARTVQEVASNKGPGPPAAPSELRQAFFDDDEASPDRLAGRRSAELDAAKDLGAESAAEPAPEAKERIPESSVDVVVEPFLGELDAAGRLVLHRLVVVGGTTYRQGLIVDVDQLAATVNPLGLLARTAALGGSFALSPVSRPPPEPADLVRRLPTPFDSLRTVLRLGETAGTGARRLVVGLAVLVGVFGLAGLVGLERMVAARLADAERRSDFVSAVTHELKTPLAAIRLHGEILREGIASTQEKRSDSYRTITAECERLTRLVDNVLELSRLEKGTRSVSLTVGPLAPVLREVLEILEPHARSSGFTLELDCDDSLSGRFDRDALVQVLLNLVDNALKYAREAEDRLIRVAARPQDGGVVLTVRDRGPGVPPRQLRKVFDPFWRGERELTRRTKGTGIGLALVRGLAERMGGRVAGRNAEDGGFEVSLFLPGASS